MPALAELIGQRAAQLNLGGLWDSSQTLCLPGSQERGDGNSRRPTPPDPCAWIPLQPSVAEHFPLFFEKIQKISHPNESPNEFKALLFVRQGCHSPGHSPSMSATGVDRMNTRSS